MPDTFLSFLPVVAEDADSVRARFNADANAGLDPADPAFIDTTEGGFFWDLTQGAVLEAVRLWDLLGTEIVAASFPGTAWGDYLDLHAETVGLERGDAVPATGRVLFTGTVGTLIAAGTQIATVQPDPAALEDPQVFTTDTSITLAVVPGPTNLVPTPLGTGGTIAAGTYYYVVTAVVPGGETIASNEVTAILSGATSKVTLNWTAVAGATAYKIYRGVTVAGEVLLASPAGTATSYIDTGAAPPGGTPAPTNQVNVTAVEPGSAGNVAAGTISEVLSPITGGPAVTNPAPTSGGADVESDDRLRLKILAEYSRPTGAGNAGDYIRWGLSIPQVGYVTVQPLWAGAGTVRVIITDQDNHPNSASVVAALQNFVDPVPGQGQGEAPIGAIVTVTTPSLLTINTVASISFEAGYSLDGASGTIPTRDAIVTAIKTYENSLPPGDDVVLYAVVRQIMSVPGVMDASGVTLNGAAANVAVGPLQVASAGTVSLS